MGELSKIHQFLTKKFDSIDDALDFLELRMIEDLDLLYFPVDHTFSPGMYARCIHMPAGSLLTSKVHKTEHQFRIYKGEVGVMDQNGEWEFLEAGHKGITKPGTRRLLYVFSDTVWETFHPTDKKTVEEVEAEIIEPRKNRLLQDSKTLDL